jgi:uncharacterized RDD family membrane protein YckC
MTRDDQDPYESGIAYSDTNPVAKFGVQAKLASRASRLGARLLDGLIGLVILLPIMVLTGYFQRAMNNQVDIVEIALYTVGGFVLYVLLHGYFLATRGQTIGKMMVGVRIVDYESSTLVPLIKLLGLRDLPIMFVAVIPCIGPIVSLVDILYIFGAEQRCVHDLLAGTKVVDA